MARQARRNAAFQYALAASSEGQTFLYTAENREILPEVARSTSKSANAFIDEESWFKSPRELIGDAWLRLKKDTGIQDIWCFDAGCPVAVAGVSQDDGMEAFFVDARKGVDLPSVSGPIEDAYVWADKHTSYLIVFKHFFNCADGAGPPDTFVIPCAFDVKCSVGGKEVVVPSVGSINIRTKYLDPGKGSLLYMAFQYGAFTPEVDDSGSITGEAGALVEETHGVVSGKIGMHFASGIYHGRIDPGEHTMPFTGDLAKARMKKGD